MPPVNSRAWVEARIRDIEGVSSNAQVIDLWLASAAHRQGVLWHHGGNFVNV